MLDEIYYRKMIGEVVDGRVRYIIFLFDNGDV